MQLAAAVYNERPGMTEDVLLLRLMPVYDWKIMNSIQGDTPACEHGVEERRNNIRGLQVTINDLLPISDLSVILRNLFQLLVDDQLNQDGLLTGHSYKRLPVQFLIGAVCSQWRDVAWHFPSLWNFIYLSINDQIPPATLQLVQEWLKRSATCPLTLRLDDDTEKVGLGDLVDMNSYTTLDRILDILLSSSTRWHTLNIVRSSPVFSLLRQRLHSRSYQFPLLSSIRFIGAANNPHVGGYPWVFKSAPPPQRFLLYFGPLWRIDIGLEYLTNIRYIGGGPTALPLLDFVAYSVVEAMVAFDWDGNNPDGAPLVPQIVRLPLLHTLQVGHPEVPEYFSASKSPFRQLATPLLRELTIEAGGRGPENMTILSDFIVRSRCQLRHLELHEMRTGFNDVMTLLQDLSALEQLHFTIYFPDRDCPWPPPLTTTFFKAIEKSPDFLPELRVFAYRGAIADDPPKLAASLGQWLEHFKAPTAGFFHRDHLELVSIHYSGRTYELEPSIRMTDGLRRLDISPDSKPWNRIFPSLIFQ